MGLDPRPLGGLRGEAPRRARRASARRGDRSDRRRRQGGGVRRRLARDLALRGAERAVEPLQLPADARGLLGDDLHRDRGRGATSTPRPRWRAPSAGSPGFPWTTPATSTTAETSSEPLVQPQPHLLAPAQPASGQVGVPPRLDRPEELLRQGLRRLGRGSRVSPEGQSRGRRRARSPGASPPVSGSRRTGGPTRRGRWRAVCPPPSRTRPSGEGSRSPPVRSACSPVVRTPQFPGAVYSTFRSYRPAA